MLVPLVCCVALAGLYLYVTPKSFTASSVMMLDPRKSTLLAPSVFGDISQDSSWVDSQIGILKSEGVAAYVVKQLRLADDPEFIKPDPSVLSRLIDPILTRLGRGPKEPTSDAERAAQAVALLRSRIDAKRLGVSYLIKIDFRSSNAEQAAKVANAVVDAYVFDQLNAKYQSNRRGSDWLQERLQSLREQTASSEQAVVEFRIKNNLLAVDGRLVNDKQITDLSNQLGAARVRVNDVQARLNRIEAIIQGDQADLTSDATVTDAMSNSIIGRLRSQYLDLVNKEADWSVRYGKNHNAVVNLRNQIQDLRKSMVEELKRIAETYKSELAIAKNLQDDLEKRLGALMSQSQASNRAQIELASLEATAQSYRKLYDNFLQRYTESIQQQSFPNSEARLISPAGVSQTYPVPAMVWLIGAMAGAVLGLGLAGLRELTDRVFRTTAQVQSVLDAECLGFIPLLKDKKVTGSPWSPNKNGLSDKKVRLRSGPPLQPVSFPGSRRIRTTSKILRTIVEAPLSQYTEAIRSIKLSADLNAAEKSTRVIGLTSSLPGEGKTSAAMALAQVATLGEGRVILLDCDLRNPSLSRALAPDAKVGFIDVVLGRASLEEALWTDPLSNLTFLPTVYDPLVTHSTEILASRATRELFHRLQAEYDYLIVDLSPLAPVADVRATSRLIDAYILVVEWGHTKIEVVQRALSGARSVRENILGVVLNKVDMDAIGRYDRYGAKYYRHSAYAE